jgi:hypothetical protein
MSGIIGAIVGLATEVFKLINSTESRKYIDELVQIQEDLLAERSKGDLSDDAKIEYLYRRIQFISEAAREDIIKAYASK